MNKDCLIKQQVDSFKNSNRESKRRTYRKFIFEKYNLNRKTGVIELHYSLDDNIHFVERFGLNPNLISQDSLRDKETLDRLLFALSLAVGVSYWKTTCPPEIIIKNGTLTPEMASFWNTLYTKGLGEFFYTNRIDFRRIIRFPFRSSLIEPNRKNYNLPKRALVLLGGGKDSATTAVALSEAGIDFDFMCVGESNIFPLAANRFNKNIRVVTRYIDSKLFWLNKMGSLNGHVPFSAIIALLAIVCAFLWGYRYVIVSNGRSSDYSDLHYLGMKINHSYSKSYEFEKKFQDYIERYLCCGVKYFSFLRPFYELKIAQAFATKCSPLFPVFTSCNKNFTLQNISTRKQRFWCKKCPKCASTFSLLYPFLKDKDIFHIFDGNLYMDNNLWNTFQSLMNHHNSFECVGTPNETVAAMFMGLQKGYKYNILEKFEKTILPKLRNPEELVNNILNSQGIDSMPANFSQLSRHWMEQIS